MPEHQRIRAAQFVTLTYGRHGGAEIYNLDTAAALAAEGVRVEGLSVFGRGGRVEGVDVRGLSIPTRPGRFLHRILWPALLGGALELRADTDLVVVGHVNVLPPAAAWARRRRKPVWLIAFGIDIWRDWTPEEEEALNSCDRIIALSEYTATSIRQRLPARHDRVVVVTPRVDVSKFPFAKMPPAPPWIVLTVGRLSSQERYKGHDLVIQALPAAIERVGQPIEYWIVGDGDDRARLEALTQSLGLTKQVRFHGAVWTSLADFYRKCHLHAMPSYVSRRADGSWTGEGFGIVYIEAGAVGRPSIACKVGGQRDAVLDGESGWLVEPTVDSVADALVEAFSHPDELERRGRLARNLAETRFGLGPFRDRYGSLLKAIQPAAPGL
jgi:phosphatidylinositol alpha-1,6-mannosyltransferase